MGWQRRHRGGVIILLLAGLLLGACGKDERPTTTSAADRPSMEKVIDDRTQMRVEMLAAVDAIFGPGEWVISSSSKEISGSACRAGDDPYDGRYTVGSAVNTVLGIGMGCHRWDTPPAPAPAPAPTGVPDYAKKDKS